MSFCGQCGNQIEDGSAFCPFCGAKNQGAAPQPQAQPFVQQSQQAQPYPQQVPDYSQPAAGDNFFTKIISGMKSDYYNFGRSFFDLKFKIIALAGYLLAVVLQFVPTMVVKIGSGLISASEKREAMSITSASGFMNDGSKELFDSGFLGFIYFLIIVGSWVLFAFALLHVTSYKQDVYLFYKRMALAMVLRHFCAGLTFFIFMMASGRAGVENYLGMSAFHFLIWALVLAAIVICFIRSSATKKWKSYSASMLRRIEVNGETVEIDIYPYVEGLYYDEKSGQLYQMADGSKVVRKLDGAEFQLLKK